MNRPSTESIGPAPRGPLLIQPGPCRPEMRPARPARQSTFAPESLTTLAHFAISVR